MLSAHTSVSIAQVVFYAPIPPTVFYIVRRIWSHRPRMPWLPLFLFSLIRLVGGILVIVQGQQDFNLGLTIAAIVLLNVGMIPLVIASLGFVRLLLGPENVNPTMWHKAARITRIVMIIAVVLLSAGGGLEGSDSTASIGKALAEAGYVVFACTLLAVAVMLLAIWRSAGSLPERHITYLTGASVSIPFLAVRTAYGLLYVFNSSSIESTWNPLFGSAVAFALMALLPEYITIVIYIYLGFYRIREINELPRNTSNRGSSAKESI